MKKIIIPAALAVLVGAAIIPALAQTTTPPPAPPPAAEQQDEQEMDQMADTQGYGHHRKRHRGMGGEEMGRHGMGGHGMGKHGGPGRMIDANGDNIIGDSEAASLADREFMRLDRDGSGDIAEAEFTTPRHRGGWWQWSQSQDAGITEGLKSKFTALDADKDAKVTKAEFMADAKTRFAAADADKDGKVNPWEFYAQN